MRRVDFSDYRFRCSSLGKLMTKPRNKSELISKTTMSYLNEVFKEEVFNRRKEVQSMYLEKGKAVENEAMTLYSEVIGVRMYKNRERLNNDFFTGEPDIVKNGKVHDIKSSWDFETFPLDAEALPTKDYYYQVQGYMNLTGAKEAVIAYCLVNTPETLIMDAIRKASWKMGMIEVPEDLEGEITRNLLYQDIPKEFRVQTFEVAYDPEVIEELQQKVVDAREYLNNKAIRLADRLNHLSIVA